MKSRIPIYEQLYKRIIEHIAQGVLKADDPLPSIRKLAMELGVNPNTVSKAYSSLESDGIIYSTSTKGSRVMDNGESIKKYQINIFDKAVIETLRVGFTPDELVDRVKEVGEKCSK
jgi:GntR family transcriptional regulator